MYKSLLNFFVIIDTLICLFTMGSGFLSPEYAKFNIYLGIPLIYILYILPINITDSIKRYYAQLCIDNYPEYHNKLIDDVIYDNSYIYVYPIIHHNINNIYTDVTYYNPVNYQGLLVLSYIINIYVLKYKWNDL